MQTCPNCNHLNRPGVVFCDNCGASLIGDAPLGTKNFGQKQGDNLTNVPLSSMISSAGSDLFNQGTVLRIEIDGSEPILLKPQQETIFGRRDPATGEMPDVDLTPFAGYRMGVSRRHAAIRRTDGDRLDLWDLGSSNGTFLNGTRLAAHRPNKLHDGDQIRLGQMMVKVYFLPIPSNLEANQPSSAPTTSNGIVTRKDSPGGESPSGTILENTAALNPVDNPVPNNPPVPTVPSNTAPNNPPVPPTPSNTPQATTPADPPAKDAPKSTSNDAPPSPIVSSSSPDNVTSPSAVAKPGATANVPPNSPSPSTPAKDAPKSTSNDAPSGSSPAQ